MRVFVTGGTGFIGNRLVKRLRDRGDEVVALARPSGRAAVLEGLGCKVVLGDLNDRVVIEGAIAGCESVFHIGGRFEVGVRKSECPDMQDVNIGGVRRVIDAAIGAGVSKIVHASSVTAYGNTNGATVDESFLRDPLKGFLSCYDESKYRSHLLVLDRIQKGVPAIIVAPGSVYGPGDHSEVGRELVMAAKGELPAMMLVDVGLNLVHVDDVVNGFLLAHDNGKVGETYVLGGENIRLRDALQKSAELAGRPPLKREIPTGVLKAIAPVAHAFLPRMGYPPNLGELIKSAEGVTYWVSDEKARTGLGYESRSLEDGLRDTLTAAGVKLPS